MFLQSNRITQIEGLEKLTHLDQLYLSHNGVTKIEGLETLVSAPEILWVPLTASPVTGNTLGPAYNDFGYRKYTGSRLQRVWLLEIHWVPLTRSPVTGNTLVPVYHEFGYQK